MSRDKPKDFNVDGTGLRVGIVAARYNQELVDSMLSNILTTLDAARVSMEDIETVRVPGSNEIPYACSMLASSDEFDVLIGLGLVMAGDTSHHDVIAHTTGVALHRIGDETETPVINGIVVVNSSDQARERCSGKLNRGREFAQAALEMAKLKRQLEERLLGSDKGARMGYGDMNAFLDEILDDEEDSEDWKR